MSERELCYRVTAEDAEIQAIEVVMTVCNMLDDVGAANRVLNYVQERIQER